MEKLIPLFFILYMVASVVSAVIRKARGPLPGAPSAPRPVQMPLDPFPFPTGWDQDEGVEEPKTRAEEPEAWTPDQREAVSPRFETGPETAFETGEVHDGKIPDSEGLDRAELDREVKDDWSATVRPTAPAALQRKALGLHFGPHDIHRAVVLAEVLGKPRAFRPYAPPWSTRS